MDTPRCKLCNSNKFLSVHNKAGLKRGTSKDITNVICLQCGLMTNNPMPSDEDLKAFYTGDFIGDHVGGMGGYEAMLQRIKKKKPEIKARVAFEFIRPYLKKGDSVLDVGCSAAFLLKAIKDELAIEGHGVEPDPVCVQVAKNFHGLKNMHQGFLQDFLQVNNGKKFHMVIMRHVLEHMKDVSQTIADLKSVMIDNGYLFLAVPDCWNILPFRNLDQVFEYGHLFSFSPYTLSQLLWRHNLKIVKWTTDYKYHLQIVATSIDNPIDAVSLDELKKGFSVEAQVKKLKMQKYRRNINRFLRKLGKNVQLTD